MSESGIRLMRASDSSASGKTHPESEVDTKCDALLDTVGSTYDSLKQPFSSSGGALHHISEAVNALASLQGAPSQLLNTGIAQIPLLNKMPGMPAATIGVPHLGTPHAHDHPPSDGFPLPSIGVTIGSGCLSVLIGGMPAARVTDIGIAPTCGGLTPYFDIQTGSSNTFVGGMRAARMGIDMTRHCNPMGHVGKSGEEAESEAEKGEQAASEAAEVTSRARWMGRAGKAWNVGNATVGPASGVANAVDDAGQGEGLSAAMMAAQTTADAAMMLLSNLMGKDPGIEPSTGMLMAGDPTVLIGGLPMPDSQMMWHGTKHGLGKKVRPRIAGRRKAAAPCRNGHPVDVVRGTAENEFVDYRDTVAPGFGWERFYCSAWCDQDGALGFGFRHNFQHELHLFRTRAVYIDPFNREYPFPRNEGGRYAGTFAGYRLEQRDDRCFVLWHGANGKFDFERSDSKDSIVRLVGHAREGVGSEFHYDAAGALNGILLTDERSQARRLIRFAYDSRGHIEHVLMTLADGTRRRIVRYSYDAAGCLTTSTDALDAAMSYAYDGRRRMIRETDRNGFSFIYCYDGESRCIETAAQDGLWRVAFDYCPGRTIATHADGGTWAFFYDECRTVTRIVDPYGNALERCTGPDGRVLVEVDAVGRELQWVYDDYGRDIGRIDRWGNCWPPNSQVPVRLSPNRHVLPATPLAQQWGTVDRRLLSATLLLPPDVERYAAWCFGRASAEPTPDEVRDAAGRIVMRTDAGGRIEYWAHDAVGNVVSKRDGDGSEYRYAMTSWNLCESATDPLGDVIRYRYTDKAKISAIVDPAGNESRYEYDLRGRLVGVMRHGVVRETYRYDSGDRLIEKCGADGAWLLRFEFGDNGLPCKRVLRSGETHRYRYNMQGKFTCASTDGFDVTLGWDAYGRNVSDLRDGLGVVHQYTNVKRSRTTWLERFAVVYEHNGEETLIRTQVGGMHQLCRSSDGWVHVQLGNGTNVLRRFDAAGKCEARIVWRDDEPAAARATRYAYSASGELRAVANTSGDAIEYQYDAAHRLIGERRGGWPVRRFVYDRAGNLISTPENAAIHYIEGNRLAAASSALFRYNDRNHLAVQIDSNGCRTIYSYNSMDLLTVVERSDRAEPWTADYDGLCRRIYQACGAARTLYYWDEDRLAAEIRPDGSVRLYVYGDESALVPFMFIDYESIDSEPHSGSPYFVVTNQVGMPEWIEGTRGEVVWRAHDIDPYGCIEVAPGNSITYDLRFPGHQFDPATGLHYNRFRTYNPLLRRYLQCDPIGQAGGVNVYAYTANPLVQVDVLGLSSCEAAASDASGGPEGHPAEDEPEVVARGPDGKFHPTGAHYPKRLIHVPDAERPAFKQARQEADKMSADLKAALSQYDQRVVTLLPFVFRKKDGSYHVGVAASKDWDEVEKDQKDNYGKLAAIVQGHVVVVGAGGIPAHDANPRISDYKAETDTDHHAEQRALRWADTQSDIDGCAYFAPTLPVCEGCLQAIIHRIPCDSDGTMKFDPNDPATSPFPKQKSIFFKNDPDPSKIKKGETSKNKKNALRRGVIDDGANTKEASVNDVFAAQLSGEEPPDQIDEADDALLKEVARNWDLQKRTLENWVRKEAPIRDFLLQRSNNEKLPNDKKKPDDDLLTEVATRWGVTEQDLGNRVKKFLKKTNKTG